MQTPALKDDQNRRYAITIIIFSLLVLLAIFLFWWVKGKIPETIAPWDFLLLTLACFRLIRLFTYDQIMRVVRDWFVNIKEIHDDYGKILIVREKPLMGGKRSLSDLLSCPWCMGIWVSYFTVLLYFAFPPLRYFVLILALAGASSALQVIMNGIGAKAEFYKKENNIHN